MIVVIPRHRSRGWAWYLKGTKNLVGAREAAVTKIAGYLVAFATLIATPVLAADMAAKAPPPAPAPSYNWTGFYVGFHAGYAWDSVAHAFTGGGGLGATCVPPATFGINGGLIGIRAGYNWQPDRHWLAGVESDFNWTAMGGTGASNFFIGGKPPAASTFQANENIDWFGTVRGRLGWLATDNFLLYGTGAWLTDASIRGRPSLVRLALVGLSQKPSAFSVLPVHLDCGQHVADTHRIHRGWRRRLCDFAQCEAVRRIFVRQSWAYQRRQFRCSKYCFDPCAIVIYGAFQRRHFQRRARRSELQILAWLTSLPPPALAEKRSGDPVAGGNAELTGGAGDDLE